MNPWALSTLPVVEDIVQSKLLGICKGPRVVGVAAVRRLKIARMSKKVFMQGFGDGFLGDGVNPRSFCNFHGGDGRRCFDFEAAGLSIHEDDGE